MAIRDRPTDAFPFGRAVGCHLEFQAAATNMLRLGTGIALVPQQLGLLARRPQLASAVGTAAGHRLRLPREGGTC